MHPITYAIGDIHGCRLELERLLGAIDAHAAGRSRALVFLGDYIDKGPDSAGVLRTLMDMQHREPAAVVCIKGNHDDLMVRAALGDVDAHDKWLTMDGGSVLAQYGVSKATALPRYIIDWVAALPTLWTDGLRYFVHAGLDPSRTLEDQPDGVRMTMRGDFLSRDIDFGRHVAHGHTPQFSGAPDLRPYRTNLDTGVVQTGALTAVMFPPVVGPPSAIIATRRSGGVAISEPADRAGV